MIEKLTYPLKQESSHKQESVEEQFIRLNLTKARGLAEKHSLEKPTQNIKSAIDITNILKDGMSWQEVIPLIKQGKFSGINIAADQVKSNEQAQKVNDRLSDLDTKVISFHGVADPYFIGLAEQPDGNLIKKDFEIAKVLDPGESSPINYDLLSADLPEINKFQEGQDLAEVHKMQRKKLAQKGIESEKDIIKQVVKHIAENRPKNSKRPVVFEMYMSYIAETVTATDENFEYLIKTAQKYFKKDEEWGVTIDVGHLLNHLIMNLGAEGAKEVKSKIDEIFKTLEKYKGHIKMVHASGTVSANLFQASKTLAQTKEMDQEAIRAWSMHQVIDNRLIVQMVDRLRKIKSSQPYIETSEVRPIHSATKYFGPTLNFNKEASIAAHKEQIKLQAAILGYNK